MSSIEVVLVPDFAGKAAPVFEARMLLFLGSWLEYGGASRNWPLHLACIGQPPASVAALARTCQARLSIHENLNTGGNVFLNKYRGFEVAAQAENAFLIDADTIVLGDLAPLAELGGALAATPTYQNRIPLPIWEELYRDLGVPMPQERILCLRGELAGRLPAERLQGREGEPMPPYYNGGVLLIPWRAGLRALWEDYTRKVNSWYRERTGDWISVSRCDQASLAVALTRLRSEGLPFRRLPNAFHGNRWFYWAGELADEETRLFHAIKFFRLGDPAQPLNILEELDLHEQYLLKGVYPRGLLGRGRRLLDRVRGPAGAGPSTPLVAVQRLCARLRALCERYVLPVVGAQGRGG